MGNSCQSLPAPRIIPQELVTWGLGGNVPHIGIVVNRQAPGTGRYLVAHNLGAGPKMEDVLLHSKITGHYLYAR
jgi:uncharacterized protein